MTELPPTTLMTTPLLKAHSLLNTGTCAVKGEDVPLALGTLGGVGF